MDQGGEMHSVLDDEAVSILRDNDLGGFIIPTRRLYPYQWNWDSAFCALGLANFDLDRAWQEIESLFDAQWSDGMVPHIVFRRNDPDYFPGPEVWGTNRTPPSSGISQPPVIAMILRDLLHRSCDPDGRSRLKKLFPKLLAWHRWYHTYRDPDSIGLIATVHPWETGRDNSPEWDTPLSRIDTTGIGEYQRRDTSHVDPSMRPQKKEYDQYLSLVQFGREINWEADRIAKECPFFVVDAGLTLMLLRADRDLLSIAEQLEENDASDEILGWIKSTENGLSRMWNPEVKAFTAIDLRSGEQMNHISSCTFLYWYAGIENQEWESALVEHLDRILGMVEFCVPSLDPSHPRFDPIRYWLGPVWLIVNYMIASGLRERGFGPLHDRLRESSRRLVEKSGFFENYCPVTGRGGGGEKFSWTAAIWLAWASPSLNLGKGQS